MPQARDEAGNIWEYDALDASGNPINPRPVAAPSAGRVFSLPPNPKDVRQEERQNAADTRASAADARAAKAEARAQATFDATNNPAPAPGDTSKTGEEYLATLSPALAAQVKAMADGRRAFPTGAALRSPQVQELVAAATQYDPTLDAADAATRVATRKDFTSGMAAKNVTAMNTALGHLGTLAKAAGGLENRSFPLWNTLANAGESAIGDPRVKNFTLARDAVANELMKVFRGTGGSLQEIEEWKHNIDSSDSPEQLHAAITQATELLHSRLEAMNDQYSRGMNKSGDPIQLLSPHAQATFNTITSSTNLGDLSAPTDGTPPDTGAGGGGGTVSATDGKSRITHDARMSSQIDAMVNAGASKGMIDAVLKKQEFPALTSDEWTAVQGWRMKNPGKKYYGANINRSEDLNLGQRVLANEYVAPVAAGLAHAADAGTAGLVSLAAGEEGRGALDAAAVLHPAASTLGDVAGGITGAMGVEAAVGARAPAALAKYAPRIADALYGGSLGFNTAKEGEGLEGAALGAGAGLAGGLVGDRAMRAAGSAFRGVRDPAVQFLRDRNIPLTVGQTIGNGGIFGRGIKKAEDALTSVPFVGNMIEARRMEGLRGFNREAFQEAGAPIGANPASTGAEGLQQLRAATGDAYDNALNPAQIDVNDPQFVAELADVLANARNIPPVNGAREAAATALQSRIGNAVDPATETMSGRNFQEAYRGLARTGRERANSDYGHEIGSVMREGQDALAGALERQFPGSFGEFRAANATHRNANVLAEALNKAKNTEDEIFTPAQLNMSDASSARRLTGPLASASGERPFYDLANAGQAVLPSRLPDSGTWTRALVGGGATGVLGAGGAYADGASGAGTGVTGGLLLTAALAAGGSRPAQRALTAALASRPDRMVRMGDTLVNNSGIGGWSGAGVFAPLLVGQ